MWKDKCDWPARPDVGILSKDDPEVKQKSVTLKAGVEGKKCSNLIAIFKRFSSWLQLKKFVALCLWMQRWFCNKKSCCQLTAPPTDVFELITVAELEKSEIEICKVFQHDEYEEEIQVLSRKGTLKRSSSLVKLDPILVKGVLCVGGRLNHAPIPNYQKHQVIVPKNSHLSKLLVWYFHLVSGHSGRGHVLCLVREKFWVVQANSTVRRMLYSCFGCKHKHSPALQQKMADLPSDRVNPGNPPFTFVGIDCFGPFYVRHKRSLVKRYGVIFTCLVVRAVHIEIESLLTLMAEVESVINSRPLTTVSSDARDLEPLIPNHLLQLKQSCSLPPGIFSEHDLYSRKRWRQVQYLADIFWKRWTREYLPLLQHCHKWNCVKRNVAVGDIVRFA